MEEEIMRWIKKAEDYLKVAKFNLKGHLYEAAGFFTQQSVEKALKALYIKKFRKLIKTHDLYFIGKKVGLPKEMLEICDKLNGFYVESRYPDVFVEFEKEKVAQALKEAIGVIEWIKKQL